MPNVFDLTAAEVVKATPGTIVRVNVIVAGSGLGSVNDCTTTGAASVANQIFAIPDTVGTYELQTACIEGICIIPGTGQTVSVSYI